MEAKESLPTLLARLRERAGMNKTELARASGVSPSHIMMIESHDRTPSRELTERFIYALGLGGAEAERLRDAARFARTGVDGRDLIEKILKGAADAGMGDQVFRVATIPILSEIPAGEAMNNIDEYPAAGYLPAPAPLLAKHPGCFGFILPDDSMAPRFVQGTSAVAAPGLDPIEGHPVVAVIIPDSGEPEMICRRWFRKGNTVTLTAENAAFPPTALTAEAVAWAHPVVLSSRNELEL